jgi:hypothetical protein
MTVFAQRRARTVVVLPRDVVEFQAPDLTLATAGASRIGPAGLSKPLALRQFLARIAVAIGKAIGADRSISAEHQVPDIAV